MSGCGGSSPIKTIIPAKIVVSPSAVSMNRGGVAQVSTTATDSSGATLNIPPEITYTSSNTSLVSISPSGLLCAGKWDTNYVVCTPATSTGTATITASVTKDTSVTSSATVYVHERVDRVEMDPTATACLSSGQTEVLTATAYSTDPAVCTAMGASVPCALPASTLGTFNFTASDADVLQVSGNSTTPGQVNARAPGTTTVSASVSGVNSPSQPFLVCPITKLTFVNSDTLDTTPFTFAKGGTKTMNVVAVDSAGTTLTNPPISYYSSNPYAITIAPGTASTATATAANSGSSALVFGACISPTCNKNLPGIYSTGIMGSVSGTYNAPIVYAASTKSKDLVPVDMSDSKAGTTVTLPYLPNSFLLNKQGTRGVLGSDANGLMILDTSTNTVSAFNGIVGAKVLKISNDGVYAIAGNATGTYVINVSSTAAIAASNFGGATAAAFSPDSKYAFFTRGTGTLYAIEVSSGKTLLFLEGANIGGIAVLGNGPLTYLAQGANINALANCDLQNTGVVDTQTGTAPTQLTPVPNGSGILALDGSNLLYVKATSVTQACPPAVTESTTSIAMTFTGTPQQIAATPDGNKAVVRGDAKQVAVVTLSSSAIANVSLAGGASIAGQGDLTADSTMFFVPGSDNAVHKIDLGTSADAAQIAVTLKDANSAAVAPDLIAVRNK